MAKRKPHTITLGRAFRCVLAQFETLDGVDPNQRRGLALDDFVPTDFRPAIATSGPLFNAVHGSALPPTDHNWVPASARPKRAVRGMPGFLEGPDWDGLVAPPAIDTPPRRPNVPLLPNWDELETLLEDHERALGATSEWERRICRAHRWLIDTLSTGRIGAWADQEVIVTKGHPPPIATGGIVISRHIGDALSHSPDGTSPPASTARVTGEQLLEIEAGKRTRIAIGAGPVRSDVWDQCWVDYLRPSARTWDTGWPANVDGYWLKGQLHFRNVTVDRDALAPLVSGIRAAQSESEPKEDVAASNRINAKLVLDTAGGQEVWVLSWNGSECRIPIPEPAVPVSRGMHAIALLLSHPEVRTSYFLLQGLKRKGGHGRLKNKGAIKKREVLQNGIDSIGAKLVQRLISIDEAHTALRDFLRDKEINGNLYLGEALGIPGINEVSSNRHSKQSPEGKAVGNSMRAAIGDAIKSIGECGLASRAAIANHLTKSLAVGTYCWWFDGKKDSVDWSVDLTAWRGRA